MEHAEGEDDGLLVRGIFTDTAEKAARIVPCSLDYERLGPKLLQSLAS